MTWKSWTPKSILHTGYQKLGLAPALKAGYDTSKTCRTSLFTCELTLPDYGPIGGKVFVGKGSTQKAAEQEAAAKALAAWTPYIGLKDSRDADCKSLKLAPSQKQNRKLGITKQDKAAPSSSESTISRADNLDVESLAANVDDLQRRLNQAMTALERVKAVLEEQGDSKPLAIELDDFLLVEKFADVIV